MFVVTLAKKMAPVPAPRQTAFVGESKTDVINQAMEYKKQYRLIGYEVLVGTLTEVAKPVQPEIQYTLESL